MRTMYFYHELEDIYEEQLNEIYEPVNICGYDYDAGRALRLIDEIAFGCGVSDWSSEEYEEVSAKDMTTEEREHYILSENQVMYCRKDEIDDE